MKKVENKDLKKCRNKIAELQKDFFELLGGNESYDFRVKLGEIANSLYTQMKVNQLNGDETVNYL